MKNDTTKQSVSPRSRKRELVGKVVSVSMKQTVIVEVVRLSRHPLYKKAVKRNKNFPAHCEIADIAVGDNVKIVETRPISKTKHFKVVGKVAR